MTDCLFCIRNYSLVAVMSFIILKFLCRYLPRYRRFSLENVNFRLFYLENGLVDFGDIHSIIRHFKVLPCDGNLYFRFSFSLKKDTAVHNMTKIGQFAIVIDAHLWYVSLLTSLEPIWEWSYLISGDYG